MILSASRRTDIPAYYSEWLINRLTEGYVFVRNPMNCKQISRIDLSPDIVDCIVFWTKNPAPMMDKLKKIDMLGYKYYFQFTITPYNKSIEKALNKSQIINTFVTLSSRIGKDKVIWRYDPIIINNIFTIEYHIDAFSKMSAKLAPYTDECIISFVDLYSKKTVKACEAQIREITDNEMYKIAEGFSYIAAKNGISIKTCAEKISLEHYGIEHSSCIDKVKIEKIISCKLNNKAKHDNLRDECGCIESVDIGAYDSCKNGCIYCYANYNDETINRNYTLHNPNSSILLGDASDINNVYERKCISHKERS